ncbi:hypothetical protein ACIQ6Y_01300 [Streptomyces sp. NPDC096205]|uniref:ABC transporter permease subunit n=1 Tax=Streptomyces sp. NPDC096205 TaxID=3366081 RepID=UPI00381D9F2E
MVVPRRSAAWNTAGLVAFSLRGFGNAGQRDLGPSSVVHLESLLKTLERHGIGLAAQANAFDKLKAIRRLRAAGSPSRSRAEIAVRTAVTAAVGCGAAYVLNEFRGLPLALLLFLAVVGLDYVLRRTPYGRKIYALGGNAETPRRAGINVALMRVSVFALMRVSVFALMRVSVFALSGAMAAVGGLFLASQITSVGQLTGSGPW